MHGLVVGQLYYVDSISNIGESQDLFHVTLLGVEMPIEGYPRTLSLELNYNELTYFGTESQIREDDFVLYHPDSNSQFLNGNENSIAIDLRNRSRDLRRELSERVLGEDYYSSNHRTPVRVK